MERVIAFYKNDLFCFCFVFFINILTFDHSIDLILTNHRQYLDEVLCYVLRTHSNLTINRLSITPPLLFICFDKDIQLPVFESIHFQPVVRIQEEMQKNDTLSVKHTSFYNPPFCLCNFSCSALWILI